MRATKVRAAGRRLAAGLVSMAALVFVLAAVPPVADAGPSGCRGWRIVPAPNPDGSANLVDALALPDGTAWAVGFTAPASAGFATVALRNSGSGWETVPTPNPDPSSNRLDGLAGTSSDDIWAVGSRSAGTLIEHWDGAGWSAVDSPNPPDRFNVLQDVAVVSAGDAWAVGSSQDLHFHVSGLIEHWDGARWKIVRTPTPGALAFLADVSAASASDVWTVGSYVEGGIFANLAMHWDGTAWSQVSVPSPGTGDNNLESVLALGSDDVWAVGYATDSGVSGRTPVAMHWDGTSWTLVPTPSISGQLISLAAGSHGRLWAAGYRESPPNTLIERWDGATWHQVRSEDRPGVVDNALFGVAVDPGTGLAWAVGSSATTQSELQTLIEQPCFAA